MATLPTTVRSRLEALFEQHRDPASARSMRAYMRDQFAYYGIGAPAQKEIARRATEGLPSPTEAQLTHIARACWKGTEREWQYFACGYLRRHVRVASPAFIDVAHDLVVTKPWWDTVDALASRTIGPLVRSHGLFAVMDDWITSDDIWLARTAILHQLHYEADTDAQRLFRLLLATRRRERVLHPQSDRLGAP